MDKVTCYENMAILRKSILLLCLLTLCVSLQHMLTYGLLGLIVSRHPLLREREWAAVGYLKDLAILCVTCLDDVFRYLTNSGCIELTADSVQGREKSRTFFIYENERWWLGKGWLKSLISQGTYLSGENRIEVQ